MSFGTHCVDNIGLPSSNRLLAVAYKLHAGASLLDMGASSFEVEPAKRGFDSELAYPVWREPMSSGGGANQAVPQAERRQPQEEMKQQERDLAPFDEEFHPPSAIARWLEATPIKTADRSYERPESTEPWIHYGVSTRPINAAFTLTKASLAWCMKEAL